MARISFWMHPIELLGDVGHVETHSVDLEMLLVLLQDRCTVCAKRTTGSEIILDIMMVLLRDEAQVDACFVLFGDSAKFDAR